MKFYIEHLRGTFVVEADSEEEAVVRFVRYGIRQNRSDDVLSLTYWIHDGVESFKRPKSFFECVQLFSNAEWRFVCFTFMEKEGPKFMESFAAMSKRAVLKEDFE